MILLEAATLEGLPPILAGAFFLIIMMAFLFKIIAMGAGRPNSK